MKKTAMAFVFIQSLVFWGTANAAFSDAPKGSGGSGSVTFNGKISNQQPIWKYEVASDVNNLNLDAKDGVVKNNYLEFTLNQPSIDILKGVTKNVIQDSNRPGLQPVITFGVGSKAVNWDTAVRGGLATTPLTLDVTRNGSSVGELSMSLKGEIASNIHINGTYWGYATMFNAGVLKAFALLNRQPYYASAYTNSALTPVSTGDVNAINSTLYLNNPLFTNYSGALIATASDFKLKVMNSSAKGGWSATLPITIVQK
ncbi:hypothetical protein [Vibrio harveyi]|uniref:F4 family fimbrial subunit n=1 Tax=Vibrio harveyi TaxID=669 RepID=UPI003BB4D89E